MPVALALTCVGCSGDTPAPASTPSRSATAAPTSGPTRTPRPRPTLTPRHPDQPVHLRTSVSGAGLTGTQRARIRTGVGKAIDGWLRAGFLAGPFPQRSYPHAFDTFTAGAKADAQAHEAVLTNGRRGARIHSIRATKQRATVQVWSHRGKPAGATARVQMVARAGLAKGRHQTISVHGTVQLTPVGNRWKIFGFDIDTTSG